MKLCGFHQHAAVTNSPTLFSSPHQVSDPSAWDRYVRFHLSCKRAWVRSFVFICVPTPREVSEPSAWVRQLGFHFFASHCEVTGLGQRPGPSRQPQTICWALQTAREDLLGLSDSPGRPARPCRQPRTTCRAVQTAPDDLMGPPESPR